MKVMTIVGTRPEIIKLSRVIALLDKSVDHVLVHTGQNYDYELNEVFFKDLEIRKPNYFLNAAGETATETISKVILESDKILEKENPDAVLLYGDTNSCLSVISAKKRKIPIFHMEAGNRCFDQRVPEEINRKIVDHLSDINMPLSEHARKYLIAEGIPAERIIKTGSSMREIYNYFDKKIDASEILKNLSLKEKEYILVSIHREENVDYPENFTNLIQALNLLADTLKKKVLVSTHPRTKKKLEALQNVKMHSQVEFMKPFGFLDYNKLQKNAYCVVSDSGTITEEASFLKMPAITIRNAHERPEGMDAGILIVSGTNPQDILLAVKSAVNMSVPADIPDYQNPNVSEQVLKIILSYVHYVNRFVWHKTL
ncbi:non-hydrolyzing UDP-N-acetylglucosamine 2-epimerase [Pseudobdellovibrio sp. HCB154]|uniref:non-hydrolyzing UDP-N-acetylglucosamine 2-epimerase n=1 Tax=Pseudobdellovibrio sp. HCB154 TaxID=3386277 RepID=UPI003917545E